MLAVIAAMTMNGVIGKNGKIPWDFPEDRKHFRRLTMGQAVVMGRRTYEEIGRALPGRMNYIISSKLHMVAPCCITKQSLSDVLKQEQTWDIYICGGHMLYQEALPLADKLYLTELPFSTDGDTFFPVWDKTKFRLVSENVRDHAGTPLRFLEYVRG